MDVKAVFAGLSVLLAVIGALGIAYAVFKSATVTKTIDLLETENKVLGQSVARQSGDIATLQGRVTSLEGENTVLRNVVTGKSAIEELGERMIAEDKIRREEHASMMAMLKAVATVLQEISAKLQGPESVVLSA